MRDVIDSSGCFLPRNTRKFALRAKDTESVDERIPMARPRSAVPTCRARDVRGYSVPAFVPQAAHPVEAGATHVEAGATHVEAGATHVEAGDLARLFGKQNYGAA